MGEQIIISEKREAKIIAVACERAGYDSHIRWITNKRAANTWAEKVAMRFKLDKIPLPVKSSYIYCDTLDMCFFFVSGKYPAFSYAGYATVGSADARYGLVEAFEKANLILNYMQEELEKGSESE